jgi:hypothetical protein
MLSHPLEPKRFTTNAQGAQVEQPLERALMTWLRAWCGVLVGGTLFAVLCLQTDGAAGQSAAPVQSGSPTYAIPLKDGNAAIVWWDVVSDPTNPTWRCEVPPARGADAGRTTTALTAAAGDWRAALAEARAFLTGRVADGE